MSPLLAEQRLLRVRAHLRPEPGRELRRRAAADGEEQRRAGGLRRQGPQGHRGEEGRPRRALRGHRDAAVLPEVPRRRGQGRPLRRDDADLSRHDARRHRHLRQRVREGVPRARRSAVGGRGDPVRLVRGVPEGLGVPQAPLRRRRLRGARRHLHDDHDHARRAGDALHVRAAQRAERHELRRPGPVRPRLLRAPVRGLRPDRRSGHPQRPRPGATRSRCRAGWCCRWSVPRSAEAYGAAKPTRRESACAMST